MIGRLQGILIEKSPPHLLIDVNGVGYEVDAPMTTFYQLPKNGETVILHTHLVVREDAQQLFGFASLKERTLFRILIRVNGVGPKLALTILSGIEPAAFVRCIENQDVSTLVKLPGVGKKTAERLVIEMRDRLKEFDDRAAIQAVAGQAPLSVDQVGSDENDPVQEAVAALIALGYKPQEASRAVAQVEGDDSATLIRLALKGMVTK